jgi:hypothetical protein
MSYGTFHFLSSALQRHQAFNFILPDPARAGPGPYACFYLIHGASDDYTAWTYCLTKESYFSGPLPHEKCYPRCRLLAPAAVVEPGCVFGRRRRGGGLPGAGPDRR